MHTFSTTTNNQRGFTLIELLVVITIIGILTALATTNYVAAQLHARDSDRKTQVNNIASAVEAYYGVNKAFPGASPGSTAPPADQYGNCSQASQYKNAQGVLTNYFYYYSYPLVRDSSTKLLLACDQRAVDPNFNPNDYKPFPSWIPGLGDFLSPIPVEKRYQGADGTATGNYGEVLTATDDNGSANQTRTFVYRKLDGGYAVYTRLEGSIPDKDSLGNPPQNGFQINDPNDPPTIPFPVTGKYIYMVRK